MSVTTTASAMVPLQDRGPSPVPESSSSYLPSSQGAESSSDAGLAASQTKTELPPRVSPQVNHSVPTNPVHPPAHGLPSALSALQPSASGKTDASVSGTPTHNLSVDTSNTLDTQKEPTEQSSAATAAAATYDTTTPVESAHTAVDADANSVADESKDQLSSGNTPSGKPPRQRRRRTSTEDQKILEAEFLKNPKPDRTTRLQIVSRVALGEKEVQIWFQNRRQSCRRRSRLAEAAQSIQVQTGGAPLYPFTHQEQPVPHQYGQSRPPVSIIQPSLPSHNHIQEWQQGQARIVPPPIPGPGPYKTGEHHAYRSGPDASFQPPPLPQSNSLISNASSSSSTSSTDPIPFRPPALPQSISNASNWSASSTYSQGQVTQFPQDVPPQASVLPKPVYLANRRSASFTNSQNSNNGGPLPHHATPVSHALASLAEERTSRATAEASPMGSSIRRSANLRLSTTSDGKARVVDDTEPSPSPPRLTPRTVPYLGAALSFSESKTPRSPTFRRAHSASMSAVTPTSASPYSRVSSARRFSRTSSQASSRAFDSRAWDYCCDPEIRNSLSQKADSDHFENGKSLRTTPRSLPFRSSPRTLSTIGTRNSNPDGSPIPINRSSSFRASDVRMSPLIPASDGRLGRDSDGLPSFRSKATGLTRAATFGVRSSLDGPLGYANHSRGTQRLSVHGSHALGSPGGPDQGPLHVRQSTNVPVEYLSEGRGSRQRSATIGPSSSVVSPSAGALTKGVKREATPSEEGRNGKRRGSEEDVDMDCVEGLLKLSQGRWS